MVCGRLAGVNDGRVWAWTVAPFNTQWSFPLEGFPDPATVLAFSADGRLLFANRGAQCGDRLTLSIFASMNYACPRIQISYVRSLQSGQS